jgi:hypothetical protein
MPAPRRPDFFDSIPGVLHGWKRIACFLDISPETAEQWAREYHLPVRTCPITDEPFIFCHEALEWYLTFTELQEAARKNLQQ